MPKNTFYNQSLTDDSIKEFINFPMSINSLGKFNTVREMIDAMKLFLHNFFRTPHSSRVMETTLGTKIYNYLGYPLNENTKKIIEDRVIQEIRENFKIFDIINVEVREIDNFANGFELDIKLNYRNMFKDSYFDDIDTTLPSIIDIKVQVV